MSRVSSSRNLNAPIGVTLGVPSQAAVARQAVSALCRLSLISSVALTVRCFACAFLPTLNLASCCDLKGIEKRRRAAEHYVSQKNDSDENAVVAERLEAMVFHKTDKDFHGQPGGNKRPGKADGQKQKLAR